MIKLYPSSEALGRGADYEFVDVSKIQSGLNE